MCQFKSALCLKDRVFVPDYDSHDRMLDELQILDDMRRATTTFVRVEVVPPGGDKLSNPMDWKVKVDQDVLPDWFMPEVDHPRIRQAVAEWCATHVLREGVHTVKDGKWIVGSNAIVKAYGNATVEARGNATVEAWENSTVKAFDNATVEAYDNATVILPKYKQTNQEIELYDETICINHRDHTIRSAISWEQIK